MILTILYCISIYIDLCYTFLDFMFHAGPQHCGIGPWFSFWIMFTFLFRISVLPEQSYAKHEIEKHHSIHSVDRSCPDRPFHAGKEGMISRIPVFPYWSSTYRKSTVPKPFGQPLSCRKKLNRGIHFHN